MTQPAVHPCPGCGARLPATEGPTHRYMESSPACWAAYGEVLAREYGDPGYWAVHQMSVDAYAVQHPGQPSPQAIQSVAVHLTSLYAALELGLSEDRVLQSKKRVSAAQTFHWLTPPGSLGEVTVADVLQARSAGEHRRIVREWANSVWSAWAPHHGQVRAWAALFAPKRKDG